MTAEQMDAGADTTPAADEGRALYPRKLRGRPVMAFASVTREQFEIRSEVGAVHIPTEADFRAYPYSVAKCQDNLGPSGRAEHS